MKTLFSLLLLAAAALGAEPLQKIVQELRDEVRTETQALRAEQKPKPDKGRLDDDQAELRTRISQMERALDDLAYPDARTGKMTRNATAAIESIRRLTRQEKVIQLGQRVIDEARAVEKAWEKSQVDDYMKTMRAAADAFLKATKAVDLDASIAAMTEAKERARQARRSSSGEGIDSALAENMHQLLIQWQNVLAENSNPAKNRSALERIESQISSGNTGLFEVLPRSLLLEKIAKAGKNLADPAERDPAESEKTVREILRSVTKVEDIGTALEKLEAIFAQNRRPGFSPTFEHMTLTPLRVLQRQYTDLKNGVVPQWNTSSLAGYMNSAMGKELDAIRGLITVFAAPRVIGTLDKPPGPDEKTPAYLVRLADEARKAKNWELLLKVLDHAGTLNVANLSNPTDVGAVRKLLAGVNFEKAQQPAIAVTSYLLALKSGSQVIPADWVGEKLAGIKKTNPKEFEEGKQNAERAESPAAPARGNPQLERRQPGAGEQ